MVIVTSRLVVPLAITVTLLGLTAGGCGGGNDTNGLEEKPAAQVLKDAAVALEAAESVHVKGMARSDGALIQLDLRIQSDASTGTVGLEGTQFEMTRIGDDIYFRADQQAWQALTGSPAVPSVAGRWARFRAEQVNLEGLVNLEALSLESLSEQLSETDGPVEPQVEQTTLDGKKVVVLSREDGSKLYVANTGPAYPLRGEYEGPDAGRIDFSEYGADFDITAPSDAIDRRQLDAEELAWLSAVEELHAKIEEPFTASNIILTRSKMVSLGETLAACRLELDRIGTPSGRLLPVHALVTEACEKYSEGAQCFAEAARVSDASGAVIEGTPEEQVQTRSFDCGFAAQGDGGNLLTEAEAKGKEIETAPPMG